MEHCLTCNNLKCRRELSDRALVTTCSHIFCLECANQYGVVGQTASRPPICPACNSELPKPDDAVITNLNPSEDYKTSVLSGLGPNIIMECAGRALSFWAYQTTQDIHYQQYLYKTLSERYSNLQVHFEKSLHDADTEMESLRNKLDALTTERETTRRKYDELSQAYREKNRRLLQVQELYDKVKKKADMGNLQQAASEAVDNTFHTGNISFYGPTHSQAQQAPNYNSLGTMNTGMPRVAPSESTMRQRLEPPTAMGTTGFRGFRGTPMPGPEANTRPDMNGSGLSRGRSGLTGIGLSSGLKVSQPASVIGPSHLAGHH